MEIGGSGAARLMTVCSPLTVPFSGYFTRP